MFRKIRYCQNRKLHVLAPTDTDFHQVLYALKTTQIFFITMMVDVIQWSSLTRGVRTSDFPISSPAL